MALGLALACVAAFQQFKLPVVLPALLAEYGYDRALAGGFMSVYALAGLALSFPAGRAIERRGPGRALALALGACGAGTLLVLVAPGSGWVVLLGRGLEGVGFAILAVAGSVMVTAAAPARRRALVTGVLAAWIPIGQLAAAALAPGLIALGGWRAVWSAGLALTVAVALWTAAAARRGTLAAIAVGCDSGRGPPAPAANAPGPRARRASLWLAGAVFMLWAGQYFAFMTWLPQYLVEVHGLALERANLGYALPVALLLGVCLLTGWLIHAGIRVGRLMVAGLAAQALCWWAAPLAVDAAAGTLVLAVYGLSAGLVPTCLFATPALLTGGGAGTARAFGTMMTGRNLGVLAGPVGTALLFEFAGGWAPAAPVLGAVTTLALVFGVALARRL